MKGRSFLVLACLALAPGAWAQEPEQGELASADKLLREANEDYAAKRYDAAIDAYQAAYELTKAPGFLYNIAQAHRLARHCRLAIQFYERFLAEDPQTPLREKVGGFVSEMWTCVQEEERAKEQPAPEAATEIEERPVVVSRSGTSPWRWVGVATAGLGVSVLAVGGYYALDAKDASDKVSGLRGEWDPSLEDGGKRSERLAAVLSATGAALAVGGIVMAIFADGEDEPGGLAVTPSHDGLGVSWMASF